MSNQIKALGEFVILTAFAPSAGTMEYAEDGTEIGLRKQGVIPEVTTVHSIGVDVPPTFLKVGDKVPMPLGSIKHVPHPDVAKGLKKTEEIDDKYVVVHYKNIACAYV